MPSLNLRQKITGLTSHPKNLSCLSKTRIFCWNFSTASPSTQCLKLHSTTGQLLDMAGLSPLTTATQHIPGLSSDLWGWVTNLSGLCPCTSSTHYTGVGSVCVCHTKAESCWKAESSPHSGPCTWWMWGCTKAPLECNCVLTALTAAIFPFLSQPSYFLCQVHYKPHLPFSPPKKRHEDHW